MATALQMVAIAAVKANLAEIVDATYEGAVAIEEGGVARYVKLPMPVRVYGVAALNRVYKWVWHQFPYREQRIIDLAVPVAALGATVTLPTELDAVRSIYAVDHALYPISEVTEMRQGEWRKLAAGTPLRTVSLPDGVDANGKAVRRIKLVPPCAKDMTIYVNGLRRFEELGEAGTPILERCSNALFDYLVAELFEFDDQQERADKERGKAGDELKA